MSRLLIVAILTSFSFGQTTASAPEAATKPAPSGVPMTKKVLEIKGVCEAPLTKGATAPCETSLTRAQFETLWHTFNRQPGAETVVEQPASIRRSMANAYASMAVLSNEARKRGLDRTPEFQLQMKVLRMQLLAKALQDKIKQQYAEPTSAELEKYYNENKASFEELSLHRLQIPKRGAQPAAVEGKPTAEPVTFSAADAEAFRKRAVAGEDFDKLQKEVIEKLQFKTTPPVTSGKRRHGEFQPQEEAEIFALSPGSVTRVMDEGSSFIIYKIDSKRTLSLDEVRGNIMRTVAEQNIRDAESKAENSAEKKLDPVYFSDAPSKEAPLPPATERPTPEPAPKP